VSGWGSGERQGRIALPGTHAYPHRTRRPDRAARRTGAWSRPDHRVDVDAGSRAGQSRRIDGRVGQLRASACRAGGVRHGRPPQFDGRYDEAEEANAQRFRAIAGEEPATGGGGGHGGPPGGRPGGGAAGGEPWEGENGLHLSPAENAAAEDFLNRAKHAESQISPVVQGAAHDTGSELLGYPDYVLKSPESFKRKLATALAESPNRNVGDALADMKDSVRYTMRFPSEGSAYSDGVNTTVQRFGDAGFESVKFKNTWGSPAYQGINSFWRDPSTGHVFEMQFHTQDSFDAKMVTHDLYEQARLPGVSDERKQELADQQNGIFNAVPRPQGASGIRPPER
jgi:hypothetical protein